ncbi:MAG: hypothetical protein ACOVQX_06525 [Legionella sp.]
MSLYRAKEILEDLDASINHFEQPKPSGHDRAGVGSHQNLRSLIRYAERKLTIAATETLNNSYPIANSPTASDDEAQSVWALYIRLREKVGQLESKLNNANNEPELFIKKQVQPSSEIKQLDQTKVELQSYNVSFKKLAALKKQTEPGIRVELLLSNFLEIVSKQKKEKNISIDELTFALNKTYCRLIGGSKEEFDAYIATIYVKGSRHMRALGAALVSLGLALVTSEVFFNAPSNLTTDKNTKAQPPFAGSTYFFKPTTLMQANGWEASAADNAIDIKKQ